MNYVQPQGYHRSMETLKIIRKSLIGGTPIQAVEKEHILIFLKSITKYADSTIEKLYLQLQKAFALAVNKKIIKENLMLDEDLVRPRSKKSTKEVVSLTQEQQKIFLDTLDAHKVPAYRNNYKKQLLLALNTGMRMGEINALKKSDIDFKRKIIKVRRTISLGEKSIPFLNDTTKTDAGRRDIPFTEAVEKLLREVIAESKSRSACCRMPSDHKDTGRLPCTLHRQHSYLHCYRTHRSLPTDHRQNRRHSARHYCHM